MWTRIKQMDSPYSYRTRNSHGRNVLKLHCTSLHCTLLSPAQRTTSSECRLLRFPRRTFKTIKNNNSNVLNSGGGSIKQRWTLCLRWTFLYSAQLQHARRNQQRRRRHLPLAETLLQQNTKCYNLQSFNPKSKYIHIFVCEEIKFQWWIQNYHWNKLENICAHVNGKSTDFSQKQFDGVAREMNGRVCSEEAVNFYIVYS